MDFNFETYRAYFLAVAENHKQIKHTPAEKRFFGINIFELEDSLKGKANFPFLGLERPQWYSGGQGYANIRFNMQGALMIVDKVKQRDFADYDRVMQNCVEIATDIMTKMIKDARLYDDGELDFTLPGLKHDGFRIEPMPEPMHGFMYGCRLSWQWDVPVDYFDITKWDNEVDYGI